MWLPSPVFLTVVDNEVSGRDRESQFVDENLREDKAESEFFPAPAWGTEHQGTGVYWWMQGRLSVRVGERARTPWFWKYLPVTKYHDCKHSFYWTPKRGSQQRMGGVSLPFIILWKVLLQEKVEQKSDPSTYVIGHWKGCQYMLYTDLSRLEMVAYSSHLERAS